MSPSPLCLLALAGVGLAGCASAPAAPAPRTCSSTVANTLEGVAHRVYLQTARGRAVAASTKRVEGSAALAAAVRAGDRRAAKAALVPLMRAQIKRIVIMRGGRRFLAVGKGEALAPVSGALRGGAGTFTLSVAKADATVRLIHELTGAKVQLGAHGVTSARGDQVSSFSARRYPRGALRISLLSAADPKVRCGATAAATASHTLGTVAKRLFRAESGGGRVQTVLRIVARDPRFVRAVAHDDPAALRAEIVHFFGIPQLHVVRIRATLHGRLVNDVGGPYVIAPASAPIRDHGRTIGRVTLSIQDDAGYIKLLHRFTGAQVVLQDARGIVPGSTLSALPQTGYSVQSFTAREFPSGPLRVYVLSRQ